MSMNINIRFHPKLRDVIESWVRVNRKLGIGMSQLIGRLATEGVTYMKKNVPVDRGELQKSIQLGSPFRAGRGGERGYFAQQEIEVGAEHARFVDEGTAPSPGGYFTWIQPLYQKSRIGGRISKDYLGRQGMGTRVEREAWGIHPGTPARHFVDCTMDHLITIMDQEIDETLNWFFGRS